MAVITGITQGIKIAQKVFRYGKKIDRKYSNLDPTNKFIQKFVPPPYRARVRLIKDILITGGVIYDIATIDWNGFQTRIPRTAQTRQTRDYMEQSGSRRKFGSTNYSRRRYKLCRQKYSN